MPFTIVRNNIVNVEADAIVNTANPFPIYAGRTDRDIYRAAGAEDLLRERQKIGFIEPGKAAVTKAFNLKAKYIIHTVGPLWIDGEHHEEETLASCLKESLRLAEEMECESVAMPLIATGEYGFPKDKAFRIMTGVVYDFLMQSDMQVILVVYDEESFRLSTKLFSDVKDYLSSDERPVSQNFSEMISQTEESFHDCFMRHLIDSTMKNSDIYHAANITKQHFSKILSGNGYVPGKNTICALALAMRLSEEEAEEMLQKAGYALTDSKPFDKAVRYFLREKMYNVVDNNILLFENDLELLGTL